MNEPVTLLALKLTSRKKSAENADVALKYKLRSQNTEGLPPLNARSSSSYAQSPTAMMSGARHW